MNTSRLYMLIFPLLLAACTTGNPAGTVVTMLPQYAGAAELLSVQTRDRTKLVITYKITNDTDQDWCIFDPSTNLGLFDIEFNTADTGEFIQLHTSHPFGFEKPGPRKLITIPQNTEMVFKTMFYKENIIIDDLDQEHVAIRANVGKTILLCSKLRNPHELPGDFTFRYSTEKRAGNSIVLTSEPSPIFTLSQKIDRN